MVHFSLDCSGIHCCRSGIRSMGRIGRRLTASGSVGVVSSCNNNSNTEQEHNMDQDFWKKLAVAVGEVILDTLRK